MKENGANLGFEQKLWQTADKLRSNMDAAEYKHVVLGLIFLKYISDTFSELHEKLKNDPYAGKKLNLPSTGNADGAGVGPNNFFLHPGDESPEDIIKKTEKGLILIRTIGHGLNPVTGDISRGAFGLWVEDGEIVFPVAEITIAGNLGTILNQIEEVGNDLEFRSTICGPTIKIQELTVAGK